MKKYMPTYPECFICGKNNKIGLKRRFYVQCTPSEELTSDEVIAEITFLKEYEGFKGIVHGGVVTALIDEAMGWAATVKTGLLYFTIDLNIRFKKPVLVDEKLTFKGKMISNKGRVSFSEGLVVNSKDEILIKASGKFFALNEDEAKKVVDYLLFEADTFDIFNDRKT